ncbi:MAG: deoxynucleoside kinase [Gammaproteobacteria bacterium]|nr:deoxynucleoside kinase [Gammaproteobacteria bacterium]
MFRRRFVAQTVSEGLPIPGFIAVEGPIGVGKTSLSRRLAESLKAQLLLEQASENPFLPQFYTDPKRYALATQLHFLCQRTQQLQPHSQADLFGAGLVADFMFEKDRLFAQIALDDTEFALYDEIFRRFAPQVPVPALVLYLTAPTEVLLSRIRRRGIAYEQTICPDYLASLGARYGEFFHTYNASPVLFIDASKSDLLGCPNHYETLLRTIGHGVNGRQEFVLETRNGS